MIAINTSLTQEQVDTCDNYLEAVKIVNRTSKILLLKFVDEVLIPRLKRREKFSNKKTAPVPLQIQVSNLLGLSDSVYLRWRQIAGSIGIPEANKIIADWDCGIISTHQALAAIKDLGLEVSLRKPKGVFYMNTEFRELWDKTVDKAILDGMIVYEKTDLQQQMLVAQIPQVDDGRVWICRGNNIIKRPVPIDDLVYNPGHMYPSSSKKSNIE